MNQAPAQCLADRAILGRFGRLAGWLGAMLTRLVRYRPGARPTLHHADFALMLDRWRRHGWLAVPVLAPIVRVVRYSFAQHYRRFFPVRRRLVQDFGVGRIARRAGFAKLAPILPTKRGAYQPANQAVFADFARCAKSAPMRPRVNWCFRANPWIARPVGVRVRRVLRAITFDLWR